MQSFLWRFKPWSCWSRNDKAKLVSSENVLCANQFHVRGEKMKESSEEHLGGQDSYGGWVFFPNFLPSKASSLAPKVSHEARPAEPGFEQGGEILKRLKNSNEKKHFEGLKEHGSFIFIHILDFLYPKKVLQQSILGLTTINSGKADVPRFSPWGQRWQWECQ